MIREGLLDPNSGQLTGKVSDKVIPPIQSEQPKAVINPSGTKETGVVVDKPETPDKPVLETIDKDFIEHRSCFHLKEKF